MKILNKYLLKEVTGNVLMVMLALIAMFSFFDLIQELEALGKGNYGLGKILLFVLLSAPGHIYDVMPVAVLVGCMYSLGQFARYSELVVLRVSGLSIFNIAVLLLKIGLMFTFVTFLVGEFVTPFSEKMAQRMRIKATDSVVAQEFRSGLWVKDGNSFINVEEVLPDATLLNIHIYEFDQNSKLVKARNAKGGQFVNDHWKLTEVSETSFGKDSVQVNQFAEARWISLIRPELLNVLLVSPEKMSAWNLYSYINHLSINKQKTTRYKVALWSKMIYPLACMVMVVLALPFGFIQQRATGASTKIFVGIMLGVMYQILNRVFSHLGLLNDWPPLFSAITPTILFLIAGLTMLYYVERR
ncbi:LPS export ABC transporter permease LptG [Methylotenera sp.]|uniref:LPS export ABC transporter permease LptG n=1 Tax=Methylotenera sp. TaxID=2051956 RepID=UPI00271BA20F|nr:LPS export ABC transporter permease LptG [Methylotenera sp.]MDO9204871.1 LPS export ABC transporter permease LptG [Methylotenera sp.]MDP2231937.1 LPS export ABC transporter permease LptG [Methylotenera sp.]MDP3141036.1 LPS export ABC transporter permease LptG [Methylotenera sp.]MDP3309063.1 LPS export ABC transporter permease LptG [Methylotenera sp.]MDP3818706.1 LPS export ABC transporter permease LptG [Methylotenera sp.]